MFKLEKDGQVLTTRHNAPKKCTVVDGVSYPPNSPLWIEYPDPPPPEPPEPQPPPEEVLSSAYALQTVVDDLNAKYTGLNVNLGDGYSIIYDKLFESGAIPENKQAKEWTKLDVTYRDLDYHVQHWQPGAITWDILPEIADWLPF